MLGPGKVSGFLVPGNFSLYRGARELPRADFNVTLGVDMEGKNISFMQILKNLFFKFEVYRYIFIMVVF